MGKPRFDGERFRAQLKLAKCRVENLSKALKNKSSNSRSEIAAQLRDGLEDRARINVKYLIRDDFLLEAYDLLLLALEDLIQGCTMFIRDENLDEDLVAPCKSVLYASGRVDSVELTRLTEQMALKLGPEFCDVSSPVGRASVDPRLVVKLSVRHPDVNLVYNYTQAIADCYGVQWKAPDSVNVSSSSSTNAVSGSAEGHSPSSTLSVDSSVQQSSFGSSSSAAAAATTVMPPPPPYTPISADRMASPSSSPQQATTPTFDELTERFLRLKKRT